MAGPCEFKVGTVAARCGLDGPDEALVECHADGEGLRSLEGWIKRRILMWTIDATGE